MRRSLAVLLALVAVLSVAGEASAQRTTLVEDFEKFEVGEQEPDRNWYDFTQADESGEVNDTTAVIEGNQSFLMTNGTTGDVGSRVSIFELATPIDVSAVEFTVQGQPINNSTGGSKQFITLESGDRARKLVEYYIFCNDSENPEACEFRVRFDHVDSNGQVLVNTSVNETRFNVRMEINWLDSEYRLFVNGVDDGVFPFLELPRDFGRIKFNQQRGDVPLGLSFDNWTVEDGINETQVGPDSDVADGIKQFARDIRFDSGGSKFFLGILILGVIVAAVAVAMISLGRDNTLLPAVSFFVVLAVLWLVFMEFWPSWFAVAMIIGAAAVVALFVRRAALGVSDASTGAGLVLGSLGYFVIAASLLAFAGFAGDTVALPTNPVEQTEEDGQEINETQSFAGAVTECVFTGGAFTFGLVGDCSQETQSTTFKKITDSAGEVFGWVQASANFVFQLLTFTFPVPTIFNVMIVGPPAAALAAYAVQVIRGGA